MVTFAQNSRLEDWEMPLSIQPTRGVAPAMRPMPKSAADIKRADSGSLGNHSPERSRSPSEPTDEDSKNIDCSFFVRTGTCAYGRKCKFNHPGDAAPPLLNMRGYPLRHGEPSCPHYVKRGWCAFGLPCKFNHPVDNPASEHVADMKQMHESTSIPSLHHTPCDSDSLYKPSSAGSMLGSPGSRSLQGGLSALLTATMPPFHQIQLNEISRVSPSSIHHGPGSSTSIGSNATMGTMPAPSSLYGSALTSHGLHPAQRCGTGTSPGNNLGGNLYASTYGMGNTQKNRSFTNLQATESSNSIDNCLFQSTDASLYGSSSGASHMGANGGFNPGSLNNAMNFQSAYLDILNPGAQMMDTNGSYKMPGGALPPRLARNSAPPMQQLQRLQAPVAHHQQQQQMHQMQPSGGQQQQQLHQQLLPAQLQALQQQLAISQAMNAPRMLSDSGSMSLRNLEASQQMQLQMQQQERQRQQLVLVLQEQQQQMMQAMQSLQM